MKQTQNNVITLLLCRLVESLGLYLTLRILPSLRRRSSVVMSAGCIIALAMCLGIVMGERANATSPTLTVSIPNPTLSLNVLPAPGDGAFASSSDMSFTITTDNYSGYTLNIASGTTGANATNLVSGSDTLATLPANSSLTAEAFATATYKNKWGYKPSKLNSVANTTYRPSPNTTGDTIDNVVSCSNIANCTNIAYTISIGANIGLEQPMGEYTNTFVITAVANLTSYSITYNANDGAGGANTTNMPSPNPQTGNVDPNSTTSITLASAPTRTGYGFKGWCTVQVADDAACTGTEYTAGDTYNINFQGTNTFTLYARWEEANPCTGHETELYCKVRAEWTRGGSRVQTDDADANTGLKASSITAANSGVFKYDTATFGASSDAAVNANTVEDSIYYYRGILDSTFADSNNYGTSGDGETWKNYVILSSASDSTGFTTNDTCWRIVRTTASGGVKMIYNGKWTGTTCANATTNAQVITSTFNNSSASNGYSSLAYRNIHAVGYTYNSAVNGLTAASDNTTIAKVFGTSTNNGYGVNSSDSIIKQYIEKTWFTNISAYESMLEANAGYCNDRSLYPNGSYALANKLAETEQIVPYGTSGMTVYYFGAYTRNANSAQTPTLGCPRGVVDLYSTTTASGGNGQLAKPVALLTADEASFAGSGNSASNGSAYNGSSYLRSGSNFWLLSPVRRNSSGLASEFNLISSGYLSNSSVDVTYGVRPAISLTSGTEVAAGDGTAASPWIINAPSAP